MNRIPFFLLLVVALRGGVLGAEPDTLPALRDGRAPAGFEAMWAGFDPRDEPLETEVLKEWEEEGVTLRVVRFRIGVFKGEPARLAAIYGFPTPDPGQQGRVPGLLQIHGGGQFADHRACVTNGRRGYATLSIAWAGRISAPEYRVSSDEVRLFWDAATDDPRYRVTTDWGAVDGYHAPSRNRGNAFPSARAADWTLDDVESPRNSGWFLCALAARRGLTFLERQPEVDPDRIGVYGHSMGGKLTVMTAVDPRVRAAAPSCGGISDRDNDSPLFRATIGDDVSLARVACPTVLLSPANDFHGRIGDLPKAIREIDTDEWRVTCSPHHNHQDTPSFEVATQLWFDEHLKDAFAFPRTPETTLTLRTTDGIPSFDVRVDRSRPVESVDVFYTQQGKPDEEPRDREDVMHRFWHHAETTEVDGVRRARLPIANVDEPLWVYANVRYALDEPITGAGYYYGTYTAASFNVSSLLEQVGPERLRESGVRATLQPSRTIEDFAPGWEKAWFTYRPDDWARTTHKLNDPTWRAPAKARLALGVRSAEANRLVVVLDGHVAIVELTGGPDWQDVALEPADFRNLADERLPDWTNVRRLKLAASERLRAPRGSDVKSRVVGGNWNGAPPAFRNLRWEPR